MSLLLAISLILAPMAAYSAGCASKGVAAMAVDHGDHHPCHDEDSDSDGNKGCQYCDCIHSHLLSGLPDLSMATIDFFLSGAMIFTESTTLRGLGALNPLRPPKSV